MPRRASGAQATDLEIAFDEAAAGRRVRVRRGRKMVAVVPAEDLDRLELLDRLEDETDLREALVALEEFGNSGETMVQWETIKERHGL